MYLNVFFAAFLNFFLFPFKNLSLLVQTWDEDLARTARVWARSCAFEHSADVSRTHPNFSSVGENIWAGYPPSKFDVTGALKLWVDEKQHYSYGSNDCTKVCGHYTQVCVHSVLFIHDDDDALKGCVLVFKSRSLKDTRANKKGELLHVL